MGSFGFRWSYADKFWGFWLAVQLAQTFISHVSLQVYRKPVPTCTIYPLYRQHLTVRTHAHFCLAAHARTPDVITRLAQGRLKSHFIIRHVFVECAFDPVSSYFLITYCLTDATNCLTDATDWSQIKPLCNSPLGWTVWPIRSQTQVMSPSSASMSVSEHTPINVPTRNMCFQQEYHATITAFEDLDVPRHSGASRSSQHMAASRVPTWLKPGSFGTSFTKVSADSDSVASRTSIQETCVDMDRDTVVSSSFGSVS